MSINYTDTELKEEVAKSLGDTALAYVTFEEDLIIQVVKECLREFSRYHPYLVRESLLTTAETKEVDISTLDDVVRVDYAEYRVNQYPREFRNVINRRHDFITLDVDWLPSADETVYLYCKKLQSAATLEQAHLELFARLAGARVILAQPLAKTAGEGHVDAVNKGKNVVYNYRALGQEKLDEVKKDIRMAGAKPNQRKGYSAGGITDSSESYLKVGG